VPEAQHRRTEVDRHHFGGGKRARNRHCVVAHAAAEVENASRLPAGPQRLQPVGRAAPGAVEIAPEQARGGRENAHVVVGRRGHIVVEMLGEIAAGHAVIVDRGLVTRHADVGREREPGRICRGKLACSLSQRLRLAQHQRPAGLLAHLHRTAAQRTPHAVVRIAGHRRADLAPIRRLAAMLAHECVPHPRLIGDGIAGRDAGRHVLVEVGEKVETRSVVVPRLRRHRMRAGVGPWRCAITHGVDGTEADCRTPTDPRRQADADEFDNRDAGRYE
jgi:hypothetical protein